MSRVGFEGGSKYLLNPFASLPISFLSVEGATVAPGGRPDGDKKIVNPIGWTADEVAPAWRAQGRTRAGDRQKH